MNHYKLRSMGILDRVKEGKQAFEFHSGKKVDGVDYILDNITAWYTNSGIMAWEWSFKTQSGRAWVYNIGNPEHGEEIFVQSVKEVKPIIQRFSDLRNYTWRFNEYGVLVDKGN